MCSATAGSRSSKRRTPARLSCILLFVIACGAPDDTPPTDGPDDSFGDAIADGSREARAVLHVANVESAASLEMGVGLDPVAVAGIVAARELGTLADLDAVPYVGPIALERLLAYATREHACGLGMAPEPTLAIVEDGALRGDERAWKGVPVARPPLGERRWRAPEPSTCWYGERPAAAYAPRCLQFDHDADTAVGDEDCLFVNVWTPPDTTTPKPVMVFIHGGGNMVGSSNEQWGGINLYDGATLAERGDVVVVTLQYRLNIVGYFAHPALAAEAPYASSGNYGLLDQLAALYWVQRNIRSFGGDSDRVLLFGESGGAADTCALVGSPLAAGLFDAAIIQSGGCGAKPLADVEAWGAGFIANTACAGASDVLGCLRGLDGPSLIAAIDHIAVGPNAKVVTPAGPMIDGHVLPVAPATAFAQGTHNDVPLVFGVNAEETSTPLFGIPFTLTAAGYESRVRALFPPVIANQVLAQYPAAAFPTPRGALVAVTTDYQFICPSRIWARTAAAMQDAPVYRYLYTHVMDGGPVRAFGAGHGLELFFVFQTMHRVGDYEPTADDVALEAAILGYWTRLARTGRPDGDGAVAWPAQAIGADHYLDLRSPVAAGEGVRTTRCDFWESLL